MKWIGLNNGDFTMKRLLCILIILAGTTLIMRCGDDSTTTPDTEVSVTSYIERVYGATFVAGQPIPESNGESTVSVVPVSYTHLTLPTN